MRLSILLMLMDSNSKDPITKSSPFVSFGVYVTITSVLKTIRLIFMVNFCTHKYAFMFLSFPINSFVLMNITYTWICMVCGFMHLLIMYEFIHHMVRFRYIHRSMHVSDQLWSYTEAIFMVFQYFSACLMRRNAMHIRQWHWWWMLEMGWVYMLTEEREHNPPLAKESLCLCWECAFSSSVIISYITLTFWSSSNGSVRFVFIIIFLKFKSYLVLKLVHSESRSHNYIYLFLHVPKSFPFWKNNKCDTQYFFIIFFHNYWHNLLRL